MGKCCVTVGLDLSWFWLISCLDCLGSLLVVDFGGLVWFAWNLVVCDTFDLVGSVLLVAYGFSVDVDGIWVILLIVLL